MRNAEFAYVYDVYLFEKSLQGNITAVYSAEGVKLVSYLYDAWGNFTTTYHNGGEETAAALNPFKYRGYYFDADLGFYYLESRYYDQNIRRFISPDEVDFLGANGDLSGFNLYAYCSNDPVNYYDPSGNVAIWASILIGAAIGFVTTVIKDYINDGSLFNGDVSQWEYVGSILGGAIGGLGTGLVTTVLASGVGNVVEAAFAGDISTFRDVVDQFASGAILGGVGYGISKGISSLFANKKISGILGNLSDNRKVNKRLAEAGFSYLKIGKHGYSAIYDKLYDKLGYKYLEKSINVSYDFISSLAF